MEKLHNFFIKLAPFVWGIAFISSLVVGKYYEAMLQFVIITYTLQDYADLKIKELTNEISQKL